MLDIVVMRHYIHKQPYSIICNPKYIYNKKIYATANIYITKKYATTNIYSTAILLLIYTENSHPRNYAK